MKIVAVAGAALDHLFITMALPLYEGDPNYIRPFDADVQAVFDPEKNPRFQRGDCARWLLLDDSGSPIGRIAAFFENETRDTELRVGGCGFFECINNQQAADLLFDTAKAWLATHGIAAMDGPINFGNRERWWGLLVDGSHP